MAPTSKVLVVTADGLSADGFRLGFEREGVEVAIAPSPVEAAAHLATAGLVLARAGGDRPADAEAARALVRALVAAAAEHGARPVLWVGTELSRSEAVAAGAVAAMTAPAYVRDVVTVGRILLGRRADNRAVMDGDLDAAYGVFYLVRALAAIGVTGTLMMVRGLRRGELRFFEGEVTSAQVGSLHGQAALHQLLLWTEARFELRHEAVVRRQQIPLSTVETLEQAEHFLSDLRAVAGPLSPAAVYGQDATALAGPAGRGLPAEVIDVLRLFDGHRNLADALEDSPFRVLDTLRIAARAAEVGLLRRVSGVRRRSTHRALLSLEEWLVGTAEPIPRAVVPERSGPEQRGKRGKKKGRPSGAVPVLGAPSGSGPHLVGPGSGAVAGSVEVDWSALTPRSAGLDSSLLSPVVPSAMTKGEITARSVPTSSRREEARERLEILTDPEDRDRLFAGKGKADEDAKAKQKADDDAKAKQKADDDAKKKAADEAKRKADEDAKKKAADEAKRKADEDAKKKAADEAKRKADEDAKKKAADEAKRKADDEAKKKAADEAKRKADEDAKKKAADEAKRKADEDARAKQKADEEAKKKAADEAKAKQKAADEAKAKQKADDDAKAKQKADDEAKKKAADEAKQKADDEAKKKAADEAKQKADDEARAKQKADDEARAKQKADDEARAKQKADDEAKAKQKADDEAKAKQGGRPGKSQHKRINRASGEIKLPEIPGGKADDTGPSVLVDQVAEARADAARLAAAATDVAEDPRPGRDDLPASSSSAIRIAAVGDEAGKTSAAAASVARAATAAFSDDEEAFFKAGLDGADGSAPPAEAFSDLDEGYVHQGFWDRLLGRKPRRPPRR